MKNYLYQTLLTCTLLSTFATAAHAEKYYLFAGDRGETAEHLSGIHRYSFDSENPGVLTPAPSPGQPGDIWGESAGKHFQGTRITGVEVGPNGDVYAVANTLGTVLRFDGQTGAYKGEVVKGLNKPDGLTFGPDGNLYITSDTIIVRVNPEGKAIAGAGQTGMIFAEGFLQAASGLTFGPDGHLYVSSQSTGQVLRFDGKSGRFLDTFCATDIYAPSELAFGPDGNLYVASTAGIGFSADYGFVAKFDGATGHFISRIAPEAKGALGLEFDPQGKLFVSNYFTGAISRYETKDGKPLGVAAQNGAGQWLYYISIAKAETAGSPRLKPWSIKAPRLSKTDPAHLKPSAINMGPETVKGWQNALKPAGKPGPQLTLADNKKAAYTIVLPANATTMDQKAASTLVWTLQEMTGADFRVVTEGSGAKMGAKIISIGRTNALKAANLKEAGLKLGDEGYAIAAKGQNIYLWGGKVRGALYAVFSLLEEDLNCRWYAPGQRGSRVPRRTKLTFSPTQRHYSPVLVVRDPFYYDAFNGDWSLRNKTQSSMAAVPAEYGGYAQHALFVHTYDALVPPAQYFKEHPEYYAEVNGKRQTSQLDLSNPDVLRIATENVRKYLRGTPSAKFISVSPNDGRGYCECPICSKLDKEEATAEGSKSGSLINFCNKVADAIQAEFPDVKISTLAYLDTFLPPKTIRPHKNVVIQLCTDSHAWKYQFDFITESQKFQNALKAWHAINADMYIWDYTTDYVHYQVPMPNMPVVTANFKFYIKNGAKGVMLQGTNASPGGENAPMRSWVWAKQLWNPNLDTRALMKDFIYGYYGAAAEPLWKYNDMLWQMWVDNHKIPHVLGDTKPTPNPFLVNDSPCSAPPDWMLMSPEFLAKATALMKQAEGLAKDDETKRRVLQAKLPIIYLKLGQGLGYIEEMGGYHAGTWTKNMDPAKKPYYQALFKEYSDLTAKEQVSMISERTRTTILLDKWRDILNYDPSKLSVFGLNPVWKFKTDPRKEGLAQGWQAKDVADGDWANVRSDINKGWEGQGFADYRGDTWYRQKFTLPADFKVREKLYLFFTAIDSESEIYINGVKAFDHTLASTGLTANTIWNDPFFFDPTPFLKMGEENTIAVKVSSAGGIRGIYVPAFLFSSDKPLLSSQMLNATIVGGRK